MTDGMKLTPAEAVQLETALDYDIPSTVCKAHKRFIPCRGDIAECQWSTEPGDVAVVRAYQESA